MTNIELSYPTVGQLVAAAADVVQKGGQVTDAFEIAGMFYLRYKEAVVEKVVVETKVVQAETAEKQQQKPRKGKPQ